LTNQPLSFEIYFKGSILHAFQADVEVAG